MKIHTLRDKFEVVSQMYETLYVAEFATEWPRKFLKNLFLYIFVCVCGGDFIHWMYETRYVAEFATVTIYIHIYIYIYIYIYI